MNLPKGCCWIFLAFLIFIISCAFLLARDRYEWCDDSLNLGNCRRFDMDDACYCIDGTHNKTEIYERAQANCEAGNGQLATPDLNETLIWLSKRMYSMGVDEAFVGLMKINGEWKWVKRSGEEVAGNIAWREGFNINHLHQHAVVNVKTIKKSDSDANQVYENEEIYYNYDYYLERDKSYMWYGFSTSSDTNEDIHRMSYYICHYTSKPETMQNKEIANVTTPRSDVTTQEEHIDDCFCRTEDVFLKGLGESQTFTSPGYPKNYCSDNSCRWVVSTEDDFVIKLEWVVFKTENEFDKVYIYDGESSEKSELLEICFGIRCSEHISSDNKLQIHFSADHVRTDMGFKFRVTVMSKDPCYCSAISTIELTNVGESYTASSPNNPNPYCVNHQCSWSITAPEGYGLNIVVNEFSLEHNADYLYIYDGLDDFEKLLGKCTGTEKCEPIISPGRDIRISFESDAHASGHLGFSAVVTAVPNYCTKESLVVPVGTVTYSEVRDNDGQISVGGVATLTCPPSFKISQTINDTVHNTTCELTNWDRPLEICIQVCENIKLVPATNGDDVHVCELYDETMDILLVPADHPITLKHYDLNNFEQLTHQTETISCSTDGWTADHPICHTQLLGILIVGGGDDLDYYKINDLTMELYNPFKKSLEMINIKLPIKLYLYDFAAAILPDGHLFITEGSSSMLRQPAPTYMINLQSKTTVSGPEFSITSRKIVSAILDDILYMCWGGSSEQVDNEGCETLEEGREWQELGSPNLSDHCGYAALVASQYHIYMIGGTLCGTSRDAIKMVEKYSPEGEKWELVADMKFAREGLAAAFFNDDIIVCGGEYDDDDVYELIEYGVYSDGSGGLSSCEKYVITKDRWYAFPSMVHPRRWHSLVVFGGKLFALLGSHRIADHEHEFQQHIEVFDVENNMWQLEMGVDGKPVETLHSHEMGKAVAVPRL